MMNCSGLFIPLTTGMTGQIRRYLRKANPNMGISVYSDYLLSQQRAAINKPTKSGRIQTKHLNIWVAAKDAFFNLVNWQKCEDRSLTLERFEGIPAFWRLTLRESWI
ncbi:terminase TerL endonuclease subunit [Escherichia coli]|uniref:terminase TerL endonuclease subunit n=1 Tax=Escherichia coli TaxID=562 RepID=UPI003B282AF5